MNLHSMCVCCFFRPKFRVCVCVVNDMNGKHCSLRTQTAGVDKWLIAQHPTILKHSLHCIWSNRLFIEFYFFFVGQCLNQIPDICYCCHINCTRFVCLTGMKTYMSFCWIESIQCDGTEHFHFPFSSLRKRNANYKRTCSMEHILLE